MMKLLGEAGLLLADQASAEGIEFLLYSCFALMGLAIPAMVLGTACKIARVEAPEFFGAMGIVLIAAVAVFFVDLMFAAVIAISTNSYNISSIKELFALLAKTAPVIVFLHPFIIAGIYSMMLRECSYLKGLLIWVLQLVVIVVFLGAFFGIAYVFLRR